MTEEEIRQSAVDEEDLRFLAVCYRVLAGVAVFVAGIGLLFVLLGAIVNSVPGYTLPEQAPAPPEGAAPLFALGFAMVFAGFVMAALRLNAALALKKHTSLGACRLAAVVSCLEIPYGTFFGIMTLVVLARPSVQAIFSNQAVAEPVDAEETSFEGWA
jgi:hypothetical protein